MSSSDTPVLSSKSIDEQGSGSRDDVIVATKEVEEPYIPEGGSRAWLVILGAFLLSMSTHGYLVSWGTFQQYYELTLLRNSTSSDIAWIGSIQYSLTFMLERSNRWSAHLGYFRIIMVLSCSFLTAGNFLIAECTKYWHFILVQGVVIGFSIGCIYSPCIAVVSHWFKVRRPIAFAIVALGACVGGIIYPIIFWNMISNVGFKWTVRTISFINTATYVVACLGIVPRLERPKILPKMLDLKASSPAYFTYVISTMVSFLGLYTHTSNSATLFTLTYVSLSGVANGMNPNFAFYMIAIANAASAVGRLGSGALALRYGPMNIMIIFMTAASAFTYAWPYATNHGAFIFIIVMYGITSGSFISLFPAPVAQMGGSHDVGRRLGMQMTVMAFGALGGPPTSGAILGRRHSFHEVGIFAGTMILGSVILMILARFLVLKRWYGGKL